MSFVKLLISEKSSEKPIGAFRSKQSLKGKKGKAFADKGYISKRLNVKLLREGVHLMTKVKKHEKPTPVSIR